MTVKEYNICVETYSDNVYRFILRSMRDGDEAQDIVQESFTKMWERVERISFEKSKSYLFTTAYHTMIDRIRKGKRISSIEDASYIESFTNNQYTDLQEILERAVDRLSKIQKDVVLLRDYEGYSYEEIGRITDLSESQVKVYIYRARKTLRQYIGKLENVT
ncbi:MAG: RNA polymerase sigma factor [Bacteroidota bacterium]|nr:RNA polymerase sigma factor [Bacteroidota bacterium]